jgi:hypothetical protein
MNPKVIPIQGNQQENRLIKAMVKGVAKQTVMIDTGEGVLNARTAFSCLVLPLEGDTVLVNQSGNDFYILSVLEREAEQDMTLNYPANVKMTAASGQIDIVSSEDINLTSASDTRLLSRNINMNSAGIELNTGKLNANAQEVESHSKTVKLYTSTLNIVAKQMVQRTELLMRWVEGVETLNIGNLIQKVRHNYTSHSNQAVITATQDMKIDGERIHMG